MHGRWRLFRHDAGQASGPPAWTYVVLFTACLLIGIWSARTFGAVVIWPANGVMLAALLQLHRRKAITVLAVCLTINLLANVVRGDAMPFLWLNALLNLGQVCLAGLIARRVGGAALDLRRPRRLANFALLAVTPAVLLSAVFIVTIAASIYPYSWPIYLFTVVRYSAMEILGMLMVTPTLLLIAKSHRFRDTAPASPRETLGLFVLLTVVTTGVFIQPENPLIFMVFPVLMLVAASSALDLRLSGEPSLLALALILALAMAPMLARVLTARDRSAIPLLGAVVAIVGSYLIAHWASGFVVAPVRGAATVEMIAIAFVAVAFLTLFALQAIILARPTGRLARAFYPACFAGFYLDEVFTRLTFRIWPPTPSMPRLTSSLHRDPVLNQVIV